MTNQHLTRRQLLGSAFASLATLGLRRAKSAIGPWPAKSPGAVSLTYDDGLDCHLDVAVSALDARRLDATFFVTMENIRSRLNEWEAVASHHELGNHTVTHPCDLRSVRPEQFAVEQIRPMETWLRKVAPNRATATYAYPCDVTDLGPGSANQQAKRYAHVLAREGIHAARTSEGPPNPIGWVRRHPYNLQSLAVGYDSPDVASVRDYLERAASEGRWAILVFHRLTPTGAEEGATSIAMHASVLDLVRASPLWCAPLGEVFARVIKHQSGGHFGPAARYG